MLYAVLTGKTKKNKTYKIKQWNFSGEHLLEAGGSARVYCGRSVGRCCAECCDCGHCCCHYIHTEVCGSSFFFFFLILLGGKEFLCSVFHFHFHFHLFFFPFLVAIVLCFAGRAGCIVHIKIILFFFFFFFASFTLHSLLPRASSYAVCYQVSSLILSLFSFLFHSQHPYRSLSSTYFNRVGSHLYAQNLSTSFI